MREESAARSNTSIHPGVLLVGALAYVWILAVLAFVLGASAEALFVIGISTVFLLIYLGVPGILAAAGNLDETGPSLREFLNRPMRLWTGTVHGKDAAVQVVLIPLALAVGMTAIGIVIAIARASVGG